MKLSSFPVFPPEPPGVEAFLRRLESRLLQEAHGLIGDGKKDGGLVSLTLQAPELDTAGVSGLNDQDLYWAKPDSRLVRVGMGQAIKSEAKGRNRLAILDNRLKSLHRNWLSRDPDRLNPELGVFVGMAFDPEADLEGEWENVPNAVLYLPELLYAKNGAITRLTFTARREPNTGFEILGARWMALARDLVTRLLSPGPSLGSDPSPLLLHRHDAWEPAQAWPQRVDSALAAIARGELDKVVLTRSVRVRASRPFAVGRMLNWLEAKYPNCIHFAIPLAGKVLVGVTPERLICLDQRAAITDAIAGTRRLGFQPLFSGPKGNDPLDHPKPRREQRLVVDEIARVLEPLSDELKVPEHPLTLTLPHVQHLWSPIQAVLREKLSLLDLAARLHPTPAIGGSPCGKALTWLRTQGEPWRGWYTGALGWATGGGDGELAVVLRCALLDDDRATLFAGAGILHGSAPEQEFLETEWKLQSMLEALRQA